MAEITKIVDDKIEITKTPEAVSVVETLTRKDVVGKRAEAQTVVDHLQLDLDAAKAEVAKLDAYLVEIDKVVVPK